MSLGIDSLHKVLKDETRRKIVLLLHEKGSLCYTDLMKALGIANTGKMNYHLKILGDLLLKREDGQYALTEKGVLASRLLLEYPEDNKQQLGMKPKWWRKFWIGTAFFVTVSLIISFAAYFLGYINLTGLYRSVISIIGAMGIAYMIQHITRDILSKNTQMLLNKIAYTALGVWLGLAIAFFGGVLILDVFALYLGGLPPDEDTWLWILAIVVLSIIGGIWGYRFGKKRSFKRPEPKWPI
jgi:MFS family permease